MPKIIQAACAAICLLLLALPGATLAGQDVLAVKTAAATAQNTGTEWVRGHGNNWKATVSGTYSATVVLQSRFVNPATGAASSDIIEQTLPGSGGYTWADYGSCEYRLLVSSYTSGTVNLALEVAR